MGSINIHAGDFKKGRWHEYLGGNLFLRSSGRFFRETIPACQLTKLECATEASVVSLGGAAGWGIAGSVLLGPVGLVAGLLLGGRGKHVTFICVFQDGRKFLGTASSSVFAGLQKNFLAATF